MTAGIGRILAGLVCVAAFPAHLCLCLLIRLWDGGPALYRSRRIGRLGETFELLKYRTMRTGSAPVLAQGFRVVVGARDPRVFGLGKWLRCGLDELPQLWNIVRGEMAWVGPRPDLPWMLPNYGPATGRRLSILPGITGLAQVLNSRNLPTAEGYAIDLWYCSHQGLWLDLWIASITPLFMAGWLSAGSRRIARLHASAEFQRIREDCGRELAAAGEGPGPFPEGASIVSDVGSDSIGTKVLR
jgi:lipopolysaccharide/colanic/teichoic acid biosynthesis glycosyltransferase